jgi:hypothetical protein
MMAHRMNISIPDDLKTRMDAHGGAVNWSRVAADAFERTLAVDQTQDVSNLVEEIPSVNEQTEAALELLLDAIREDKPELVEKVRAELGPVLRRATDREHLRQRLLEWRVEVPWPVADAQSLVKAVSELVFEYHSRVMEPLLTQLLMEIVSLRIERIAEKSRA